MLQLYSLRAIRLGTFTLKNEVRVPLRIELSALFATPKALRTLGELLAEKALHYNTPLICGVPNMGLVLGALLCTMQEIPLVTLKNGKIEGVFKSGSRCLVVSDILQPRASLFETLDALEEEGGLEVRDVLVAIDWQQGGKEKLRQRGIQLHSLLTVSKIAEILSESGKIGGASVKLLLDFFETSKS